MAHVRGLVLLLLAFPGIARRAQQGSNDLKVSADSREALIPQVVLGGVSRLSRAGALRVGWPHRASRSGGAPRQARFVPVGVARVAANPAMQLQSTPERPVLSARLESELGYPAGVATKAGLTGTAKTKINQDDFAATKGLILVCDGHGKSGEVVSREVAHVLPSLVFRALSGKVTNEDILSAFRATDEEVKKLGPLSGRSGSTAVAVLIAPPKLLCMYVGDSFAILGRRAAASDDATRDRAPLVGVLSDAAASDDATRDSAPPVGVLSEASGLWTPVPLSGMHKPDMPQEQARIIAAGGSLTIGKNGMTRVNGLALSRAFGDFDDKNAGVIAEPEVNLYDMQQTDDVVVVGSDGVWDVLDQSEVLALLEPYWTRRDAEGGAKAIVEAARDAWSANPSGYRDDITCVVAWLQ